MVDEAASRLKLEQESKPENLENLERQIITLKIEASALNKVPLVLSPALFSLALSLTFHYLEIIGNGRWITGEIG